MEVSGQLHASAALPPGKGVAGTSWIGGWVGSRAVLKAVKKRKIPSLHRESNPRTPVVQSVASRYSDSDTPTLTRIEVPDEIGRRVCLESAYYSRLKVLLSTLLYVTLKVIYTKQ
jgi:hypothetical protein